MIHFIVINDHPIPPATHPFPAWNAPVSSKVLLIHDPNLWVPICCQQMFIHRYSAHNPSSWDASKAGRGRIDVRSTAAGLRHCLFWSILMRWYGLMIWLSKFIIVEYSLCVYAYIYSEDVYPNDFDVGSLLRESIDVLLNWLREAPYLIHVAGGFRKSRGC